jgi:hypothetical protein
MLGGCFSFETAYLANGMKVVRLGCGWAVDGSSRCYKMAGDICSRRGFALYDWDGEPWPLPYPDPASLVNDATLTYPTLLVGCRS